MAKINAIKKIVVEDYDLSSRSLVQRLAQTLNSFLEQVTTALNGNVTLRDNIKGKVLRVELPAGTSTRTVAWAVNEKPTAVTIGCLTKKDLSAPSAAFSLSWKYDTDGIHLTFIGLDAGTAHVATIIAQV